MTDILQLASLRPLNVQPNEDAYLIEAESVSRPHRCIHCLATNIHGHGVQRQIVRDIPHHGKPTKILINRRRYRCQSCNKTFFELISEFHEKHIATTRLVRYVAERCLDHTFAAIARDVGIDEKTTILTNIERNTVFDLLESRKKEYLLSYFKKLPRKENIKWVTMDMWRPYRDIVQELLPQARIVVDKFHIQRMANEVLETMRKRYRKTLNDEQRLKFKDERKLLLKRKKDLKPADLEKLLNWFGVFPLLGEAHALKESFMAIWDQGDRASAEKVFDAWLSELPPHMVDDFKALTRAMENWREEIFSYFDNPITNAYTESANNLLRSIDRNGRGYSFRAMRARILYATSARRNGGATVNVPVVTKAAPTEGFMSYGRMTSVQPRFKQRTVEYGAHIPTLIKLSEDGFFD